MTEKTTKNFTFYALTILFFVIISYWLILAHLKNGYYIDEIFSFGYANSTTGTYLSPSINSYLVDENKELHAKWLNSDLLKNYLTVQENQRFNFSQVFNNSKQGVHPPFYFLILHCISSFFPNTFNPFIGLSVNGLLLILIMWAFFKLSSLYLKNQQKAVILTAIFCFTPLVIQLSSFIRMYELLLFLNIILLYLSFYILEKKDTSPSIYLSILITMTLAILTHLYQLIYGFFLTTGVIACLFFSHRYKDTFLYSLTMLCAIALSVAIFPKIPDILLNSSRGQESITTISSFSLDSLFIRIDYLLKQFFRSTFDIKGDYYWIVLILVFVVCYQYIKENGLKNFLTPQKLLLLYIAITSCAVISVIAPDMRKFNGRYYSVSALCFILWFFPILSNLLEKNKIKKIFGLLLATSFIIINAYNGLNNPYLQKDNELHKLKDLIKDKRVVTIIGHTQMIFEFVMLESLTSAKEIYKLNPGNLTEVDEFLKSDNLKKGDIVTLYAGMGKNINTKKTLENPQYRLKYKTIIFDGIKTHEIYERY